VASRADVLSAVSAAEDNDHATRRLFRRVRLAVHRTGRHAQEVAGAGLDHVLAAGAGLQHHAPAQDVQGRLEVTVVVPARGRVRVGVDGAGPHPVAVQGELPGHPGRRVGVAEVLRGDHRGRSGWVPLGHGARLGPADPWSPEWSPYAGRMYEDVDRLLAEREERLDAELAELPKPVGELGTISFGKRVGEGTSMAVDRLAAVSAQEHLLAMLDEVRRARRRIAEGTHSTCEGLSER